ncbi:MAG: PstS family phosphate ABC transporter substrate-binding protein [Cyanobacteria bacterium]|nr:PstS family phosphate ABC transporter substrate-binding protein [Cyanobacteriota bacterium]
MKKGVKKEMVKKGKQVRRGTILLISLAMVFLFLTTSILAGCKTNTVAETTAAVTTTATETTAVPVTTKPETTAAASVKFTNEKLIVSGSTTLLEVAQSWAEAFMSKFGGEVTINGGGSGVGISDLINGTTDLANASRAISSDETAKAQSAGEDIKEYKVLIDGICVVTSKNITIPELTINQLSDIYTGKITNWKEAGGPDAEIIAIARDSSSGTGEFFLQKVVQLGQTVKTNNYSPNDLRLQSNADVVNQVISNSNAIGYIGMGYLKDAGDKVNVVKVKSDAASPAVTPSITTVSDFSYPISRYCYIYANTKKLSAIARAYLDFVLSADGQNIAEQAGFVKVQ